MTALIGIIIFHTLILLRAQNVKDKSVPYGTVFFLTLMLVAFVTYTLMTMEKPEP